MALHQITFLDGNCVNVQASTYSRAKVLAAYARIRSEGADSHKELHAVKGENINHLLGARVLFTCPDIGGCGCFCVGQSWGRVGDGALIQCKYKNELRKLEHKRGNDETN